MSVKKGNVPWNKGKKTGSLSEETKQKLRKSHKGMWNRFTHPMLGKHHSEETILKKKKQIPWNKGKKNVYSKETLQKMIGHPVSKETKQKLREANLGKHPSEETRQKIRENNARGMLGKHHSEETRKKISESQRKKSAFFRLNKNEEFQKKRLSGMCLTPNKPEKKLNELLQNYFPNTWRFVGDGQVCINGLCPDFINIAGKRQIIELFGDYWHTHKKNIGETYKEEGRKKAFYEFEYSTLIVWESELKDEQRVVEKIKEFSV
jgi:G:T-mismatch repair DNA endonuclease (very short patch repair protein)